jgi:hypothetical protein
VIPQEVLDMFEGYTFALIGAGYTRYSSDAILHRIRWHKHVEQGDSDFKCNDHWTSALSRWFMDCHPEHEGFFETRKLARERE